MMGLRETTIAAGSTASLQLPKPPLLTWKTNHFKLSRVHDNVQTLLSPQYCQTGRATTFLPVLI